MKPTGLAMIMVLLSSMRSEAATIILPSKCFTIYRNNPFCDIGNKTDQESVFSCIRFLSFDNDKNKESDSIVRLVHVKIC